MEFQECIASLNNRYQKLKETYPKAYTDWDFRSSPLRQIKFPFSAILWKQKTKSPGCGIPSTSLCFRGKETLIYTPYIICGKEMYQDLTDLKDNNIPVEIITNDVASGANPWGCTDYLNQKEKIWKTGAKVYEFMGGHSCHTKAVLIDDRMSIVAPTIWI